MTEAMRKRVRAVHAQAAVRRSEYRQRNLAKGTWSRLRRELAMAERAFSLTADAEAHLKAKGRAPLEVGYRLHPPRTIYVVDRTDVQELELWPEELPVHMNTVLETESLALLPFDEPPD